MPDWEISLSSIIQQITIWLLKRTKQMSGYHFGCWPFGPQSIPVGNPRKTKFSSSSPSTMNSIDNNSAIERDSHEDGSSTNQTSVEKLADVNSFQSKVEAIESHLASRKSSEIENQENSERNNQTRGKTTGSLNSDDDKCSPSSTRSSSVTTVVIEDVKPLTRRQFATVIILCFINLLKYMDRFTIAGTFK